VPFYALFQARTGTRVEPPTFRKLAADIVLYSSCFSSKSRLEQLNRVSRFDLIQAKIIGLHLNKAFFVHK
jgi:hypothetical protein